MSRPLCSVIVRCFNEERHIGRLLAGIAEQSVDGVEILVVDSGSTDATVAIASRYATRILSIRPEEFSFGRSLNLGCSQARGRFLVFASAHVYPVYRDWLESLLAPFESDEVALVYGKQRGADATKYSEHRVFAKWFPDTSAPRQPHPFCNNANAAIRARLWEDFPYDEELTGLEDIDWANRVMVAGYEIAYESVAEVVHVHEESMRAIFNRYRREAIALRTVSPDQSLGLRDVLRLIPANVASDCYHAWRDGKLSRSWSEIVAFRTMQFLGSYSGFSQREPVSGALRQRFYYPTGLGRRSNHQPRTHELIDYSKPNSNDDD